MLGTREIFNSTYWHGISHSWTVIGGHVINFPGIERGVLHIQHHTACKKDVYVYSAERKAAKQDFSALSMHKPLLYSMWQLVCYYRRSLPY